MWYCIIVLLFFLIFSSSLFLFCRFFTLQFFNVTFFCWKPKMSGVFSLPTSGKNFVILWISTWNFYAENVYVSRRVGNFLSFFFRNCLGRSGGRSHLRPVWRRRGLAHLRRVRRHRGHPLLLQLHALPATQKTRRETAPRSGVHARHEHSQRWHQRLRDSHTPGYSLGTAATHGMNKLNTSLRWPQTKYFSHERPVCRLVSFLLLPSLSTNSPPPTPHLSF